MIHWESEMIFSTELFDEKFSSVSHLLENNLKYVFHFISPQFVMSSKLTEKNIK